MQYTRSTHGNISDNLPFHTTTAASTRLQSTTFLSDSLGMVSVLLLFEVIFYIFTHILCSCAHSYVNTACAGCRQVKMTLEPSSNKIMLK